VTKKENDGYIEGHVATPQTTTPLPRVYSHASSSRHEGSRTLGNHNNARIDHNEGDSLVRGEDSSKPTQENEVTGEKG